MKSASPIPQEVLTAAYLDQDGQVRHFLVIDEGEIDAVSLPVKIVVEQALINDCRGIILLHNHPSGDPRPSEADISATRILCRTTSTLDLHLVDHLIIGREACFSFRAAGLL